MSILIDCTSAPVTCPIPLIIKVPGVAVVSICAGVFTPVSIAIGPALGVKDFAVRHELSESRK